MVRIYMPGRHLPDVGSKVGVSGDHDQAFVFPLSH
jgi:hypothetical protein